MGKIEESGASVGSMLPVTPVDQVLTKNLTAESVDAEFNALQLNKSEDTTAQEPEVELPADVPPAESPVNPTPENPEEKPATEEEIKEVNDLQAEMESYFSDIEVGEVYTEGVHGDMKDSFKKYFKSYKENISNAKKSLKAKKYDECIKYAKNAASIMDTCKKEILSIRPNVLESIFGSLLRDLIFSLKYIISGITTFGIGNILVSIKEGITALTGILEEYKENGFSVDLFDNYKTNLIGNITLLISYANSISDKAKKSKSNGYNESVDDITGDEYLYLEECMNEIEKLSKQAGIISPSTSVKEGEDTYVFEGYAENASGETAYLESGDKSIDEDIKPIIEKLNKKGYKTIASCSGHPSARSKDDRYRDGVKYSKLYSTARVVFDKIYDFPNIPEGWTKKVMEEDNKVGIYVDPPRFKIIDGLPEKNYANWKRRYMRSLEKWVDELPNEGETKDVDTSELSLESVLEDVVTDAMVGE